MLDLTGDFEVCINEGVTMTGMLSWSTRLMTAEPVTLNSDLTGSLEVNVGLSFTCVFDVHATSNRQGWSVDGSICGHPVEATGVSYSHTD
jgi:hypothetical protein